jgi:hypothetical protein
LGFSDWEGVETLVKVHGGRPWIIAANTQFDPMKATFSNLPPGSGTEWEAVGESGDGEGAIYAAGEGAPRRLRAEGGALTDFFRPYEVHIYRPV